MGRYVPFPRTRFYLSSLMPGGGRLARANIFLGLNRTIMNRAEVIQRACKGQPVAAVIGCSGTPFDIPAAYVAASRMGVAFIPYLFDDPAYQFPAGIYRRLARSWETLWAPGADAVIAPNEVMAEDYEARHPRKRVSIVRNPMAAELRGPEPRGDRTRRPGPLRLVYTGSVYHAQGDAFRNLVAVMNNAPGRYELHVYTSQPPEQLEEYGVSGPHVRRHDHLETKDVAGAQQDADVLFLPLAFRSTIQEVIRSSAPAKMAEYLGSGRPVLAHAPQGSFVSRFFRERGAGVVVDEFSVDALRTALEGMASDPALCHRVASAAWRAADEFSVEKARSDFWGIVDRASA